ncbi:hypothetical protein F5Y05DRAFT_419635, partial [Hypoxylon sp. FL0543]
VLGLLRLPAAFWLTDDYAFAAHQTLAARTQSLSAQRASVDSLLETRTTANSSPTQIGPTTWASRLFLTSYILLLLGFLAMLLFYGTREYQTVTAMIFYPVYQIILAVSISLFTRYFVRGLTSTTIIPCISSWWYKTYTLILMGAMATLFVVACIQTRKTPCGKYTSSPESVTDAFLCGTKDSLLIFVGDESDRPVFGLASRSLNQTTMRAVSKENEFWVDNFTGSFEKLTAALSGQDAAVCAVGPTGISSQVSMVDATAAAGVRHFIVDDFGWGPDFRTWFT